MAERRWEPDRLYVSPERLAQHVWTVRFFFLQAVSSTVGPTILEQLSLKVFLPWRKAAVARTGEHNALNAMGALEDFSDDHDVAAVIGVMRAILAEHNLNVAWVRQFVVERLCQWEAERETHSEPTLRWSTDRAVVAPGQDAEPPEVSGRVTGDPFTFDDLEFLRPWNPARMTLDAWRKQTMNHVKQVELRCRAAGYLALPAGIGPDENNAWQVSDPARVNLERLALRVVKRLSPVEVATAMRLKGEHAPREIQRTTTEIAKFIGVPLRGRGRPRKNPGRSR